MVNKLRLKKELRSLLGGLLLVGAVGFLVLLVLLLWKPEALQTVQEGWQDWIERDDPAADTDPERTLHVLFIGNSHTYANDMPDMIRRLARAAGEKRRFRAVQETPGGATFEEHWKNGKAARLLEESRWDYVVLQEHQLIPSFPRAQRAEISDPFARQLVSRARGTGSVPVFFQTWARKDGDRWSPVPDDTYQAMQARVRQGYRELAEELAVEVVPVGDAWEKALQQQPPMDLWADDGYHANRKGSYLAACTFYAVFYRQSPVGNSYTAGLARAEARILQEVAAATAGR